MTDIVETIADCLVEDHIDLMKQLAAAQARIKELREALETISDGENWGEDGCWESSSYPDEIAMEALAIPTDTSALDAALEEAYSNGYDVGCADTTGDT